ncbi:suppressor of cytokine signaling 4 [Anopheles ziemanni]|uniref:suppressor of cytokine signaling 4 n=1 Tax=Anopheles coustani TaxID=139045 RepID=UPI00265B6661|nr:suppressor of cytokine signaling 4 [Anopheles coustani]XP_058168395.1 suppressor of cytokine signaling 4 [Anopheles ziemanni]
MEKTNRGSWATGTGESSGHELPSTDRVSKSATAPRTRFPLSSAAPTAERNYRFNWFLSLRRERPIVSTAAGTTSLGRKNDGGGTVKEEGLFINDENNHSGQQHQGSSVFYTLRKRFQKKFTSVKVKAFEQDPSGTLGTSSSNANSNNNASGQCNGTARDAGSCIGGNDFARIVIERHTQNPIRFSAPNANQPVILNRDTIPNTSAPLAESEADTVDDNRQNMDDMMIRMREDLLQYGWYWGKLTQSAAQKRLAKQETGTFLVRDSQTEKHQFTVSFRSSGITLHCRIDFENNYWSFSGLPTTTNYKTLVDLVEDTIKKSEYGVIGYVRQDSKFMPPFPVRLTKPINRFYEVSTLQHLCRFIIRQKIDPKDIAQLPLPEKLKTYVEENFYDL